MASALLDALIGFDAALRAHANRVGAGPATRDLAKAGIALRRQLAPIALADVAAHPDPAADFETIVLAARAAGVSWLDMVATFNAVRDRHPGG